MNDRLTLSSNQMILLVYVDRADNQMMQGRIYNQASGWFTQFIGLYPMLQKMENFFDCFQFPQKSYQGRTFQELRKSKKKQDTKGGEEFVDTNKIEGEIKKGDKASFVVHVQFRQNATWQGKIQWIEENREQRFRSTLELIKLMDEALTRNESIQFNDWDSKES